MCGERFWTIFSAVFTALGSIATAGAVIVALWQTKIVNLKKVKVTFSDNVRLINTNTGEFLNDKVSISIMNIGNRSIIINEWSIVYKDGKAVILTDLDEYLKVNLPQTLKIEEKLNLYYDKNMFLKSIQKLHSKGLIEKNKKVEFQVVDSTDRKYKVFSSKKIEEYLGT